MQAANTNTKSRSETLDRIYWDYVVSGALLHDVGNLLEYDVTDSSMTESAIGRAIRPPLRAGALRYQHGLPRR